MPRLPLHKSVAFGLVVLFIILVAAGSCQSHDEDDDMQQYCANVADGTWPDYDEVFTRACTADGKVKQR